MSEILAVLALAVVRIGVPLAVVLVLSYIAYRWIGEDRAIKSPEAMQHVTLAGPAPIARVLSATHCWDAKGCTAEMKTRCAAVARPELPCWLAVQMKTGHLNKSCDSCGFYEQPILRA
jgi:hypothetical protein